MTNQRQNYGRARTGLDYAMESYENDASQPVERLSDFQNSLLGTSSMMLFCLERLKDQLDRRARPNLIDTFWSWVTPAQQQALARVETDRLLYKRFLELAEEIEPELAARSLEARVPNGDFKALEEPV